jgi:2-phosphosulfolactate phosphatase
VAFGWGAAGAAQVSLPGDVVVVVDVLSFTTCVSVAVDRGTPVYPAPWRDERASELAAQEGAELAVGRRHVTAATPWSLSLAALRTGALPSKLVLSSPNGSAIASGQAPRVPAHHGCHQTTGSGSADPGRWALSAALGARQDRPSPLL